MSEAYASTLNISFDVRGGLLMRQIHHWAADLFMAAIMAHMIRVFFTGAYRKPREINWLIGIIAVHPGPARGPVRLLAAGRPAVRRWPADHSRASSSRSRSSGTYLAFFLFGGPFPGHDIIPRLYILHVLVIPGLILALVTVHLFLMFHQKHTQMPGKGRTNENVVGAPMYPYFMAKTGAFFFFVFAALTLAATFTQINPIWLYGPYNPVAMSAGSQPDFYMGALEGALRMFPPGNGSSSATRSPSTCSSLPCCRSGSCSAEPLPGRSWSSGLPATGASTISTTGRATRPPGPRSASG